MQLVSKTLITILFVNFSLLLAKFCKEFDDNIEHKFFPLRHCQRSNQTVIGYFDVESLEECVEMSIEKRGLAFNFSPKNRYKKNLYEIKRLNESKTNLQPQSNQNDFYNCEVLECPEYRNLSSMINDTRYDFYSMYTQPPRELEKIHFSEIVLLTFQYFLASENATCVPSVGMFMLFKERSNYSVAFNVCSSIGGSLAHIASDVRNVKLSKLLEISTNSSSKERTAYVGLNETQRDSFYTSFREPLSCFNFRAWAPGHPPEVRKPGCVAITIDSSWKVFNCNRKLMFICELFTSGPNSYVNNLDQKCTTKRPNNRFKPGKTSNN